MAVWVERPVDVVDVDVVGVQPAEACLAGGNDRAPRRASRVRIILVGGNGELRRQHQPHHVSAPMSRPTICSLSPPAYTLAVSTTLMPASMARSNRRDGLLLAGLAAELHRAECERADHQTGPTEGPGCHGHRGPPDQRRDLQRGDLPLVAVQVTGGRIPGVVVVAALPHELLERSLAVPLVEHDVAGDGLVNVAVEPAAYVAVRSREHLHRAARVSVLLLEPLSLRRVHVVPVDDHVHDRLLQSQPSVTAIASTSIMKPGLDRVATPTSVSTRFMVAEQLDPGRLDHRQVLAAVAGDEDRQLGDLVRPGPGRRQRATEIAEHLPGLGGQIAGTYELAVEVLGFLARDEHQPGAGRDDDMAVRRRRRQVRGIDAFECHLLYFHGIEERTPDMVHRRGPGRQTCQNLGCPAPARASGQPAALPGHPARAARRAAWRCAAHPFRRRRSTTRIPRTGRTSR